MSKKEQVLVIEPPIGLSYNYNTVVMLDMAMIFIYFFRAHLHGPLYQCCLFLYEVEEPFGQEGADNDN